MNAGISVLIVEPGKQPRMERILNNQEVFECIVGGAYGVALVSDRDTVLIHNAGDERKFAASIEISRSMNHYKEGTYFLCGYDGAGFCSLSPAQQRYFAGICRDDLPIILLDGGSGQKTACATVGDLAKAACCLWERLKAGETVRMSRLGKSEGRYLARC